MDPRRFRWYADVSGTVDLTDFTYLARNFNTLAGGTWLHGDFNYDGACDLTDFTLLAANFNQTLAGDTPIGGIIPEPAGSIALLAGAGLIRRRRALLPTK